jgi:hypothetical protein
MASIKVAILKCVDFIKKNIFIQTTWEKYIELANIASNNISKEIEETGFKSGLKWLQSLQPGSQIVTFKL